MHKDNPSCPVRDILAKEGDELQKTLKNLSFEQSNGIHRVEVRTEEDVPP